MSATLAPKEIRDAQLEAEIDAAYDRMLTGKTDDLKHAAFTEMAVLVRRRSPDQVMKLELQMRLRRHVVA